MSDTPKTDEMLESASGAMHALSLSVALCNDLERENARLRLRCEALTEKLSAYLAEPSIDGRPIRAAEENTSELERLGYLDFDGGEQEDRARLVMASARIIDAEFAASPVNTADGAEWTYDADKGCLWRKSEHGNRRVFGFLRGPVSDKMHPDDASVILRHLNAAPTNS